MSTDLIINVNPKSIFSEAIKTIRTNLAFSMIDKEMNVYPIIRGNLILDWFNIGSSISYLVFAKILFIILYIDINQYYLR